MTAWLIRRFIREPDHVNDPDVRAAYGTLAAVTGIAVNLLLSAGKFLMGLLSGSLAIMADAANNLSDAAGSIVTLITTRLARKPVDQEHPFGHGRMEYLGSLAVGVLVGALAGYLAGRFMGTETSLGRNILMGVLGSFVGEFLFGLIGIHATGSISSFVISVLGACVCIWVDNRLFHDR